MTAITIILAFLALCALAARSSRLPVNQVS